MSGLANLPQIAVAQLGARLHYAVPVLLHREGMLERLYTDAYAGPGSLLANLLSILPRQLIASQTIALIKTRTAPLPPARVVTFNYLNFFYLLANRQKSLKNTLRIYRLISKIFNHSVAKRISGSAEAIFGFDKSSVELLRWAKGKGLKCILDQSATPWKRTEEICHEANSKFPDWADDLDMMARHSLAKDEKEEWDLADLILCPSDFVHSTLRELGVSPKKLSLVRYGVDINYWQGGIRKFNKDMVLEIVFVGTASLFKGFPFLIKALSLMENQDRKIRLTIVGRLPYNIYNHLLNIKGIRYTGQIPRPEVKKYYDIAHLFIFPSLTEGSATVTYEALATGLPVITTLNSGSVVRDGIDGFIVPPMDSQAIVRAIEQFLQYPELVETMSRNALARAQEYSWENYGRRLTAAIKTLWE